MNTRMDARACAMCEATSGTRTETCTNTSNHNHTDASATRQRGRRSSETTDQLTTHTNLVTRHSTNLKFVPIGVLLSCSMVYTVHVTQKRQRPACSNANVDGLCWIIVLISCLSQYSRSRLQPADAEEG